MRETESTIMSVRLADSFAGEAEGEKERERERERVQDEQRDGNGEDAGDRREKKENRMSCTQSR